MNVILLTPPEIILQIAKAAKAKRLSLNMSQKSLADHSGVSFGSLKKFEQTGKISLESLLKIALVLDSLNEFGQLFKPTPIESMLTLDDILKDNTRKRGRK